MSDTTFPIKPCEFRAQAAKAVLGFVNKKFPKYFSVEEKEDIISDVVLRMWRAQDRFDESKGSISTWVGTIAKNVVRSAAAAKCCRADISNEFEDGEILDNCEYSNFRGNEFAADRDIMFEEFQEGIFGSLKSERDQRFLAWQIDGLDAKEMAEREGISIGNVYVVLHHMRQRLRNVA